MKDKVIAQAYLRADGSKGIRNRILIIYTSSCAHFTAGSIATAFRPAEVELIGFSRCVTSRLAQAKMNAYATHQNVGGVLVVSNGCEPLEGAEIELKACKSGRPCKRIIIQECGGVRKSIDAGITAVNLLLDEIQNTPVADLYYSDLVLGAECGGSDFTSGMAANPLIGRLFDRFVDVGATVMFEEMYEAMGLKEYLMSRCANDTARKQIAETYDKYFDYCKSNGQFFITPGNMQGGLSTIEEKSMGTVIKSGTRPIQGVVKICEKPAFPGLWMMDSMSDTEVGSGPYISEDASSILIYPTNGAHLTLLTSGRGHLVSTPIAPTIKITGNPETYQHLHDDTDIDASPYLTGEATLDELAYGLTELVVRVAAGEETKGEQLGHRDGYVNQEIQSQFSDVKTFSPGNGNTCACEEGKLQCV